MTARGVSGTPVREAAGVTVDDDEHLWTRLTGSTRDLPELTYQRARDLAVHLWRTNLLARQLIEMPLAFMLARGVRVSCENETARGWLDAWWTDPISDIALRLPEWVRSVLLMGELILPVYSGMAGHVRLGYLDPGRIATVVYDPDNASVPIGLVTRRDGRHAAQRWRVLYQGPETIFGARAQAIRATMTTGDAWYFRAGALPGTRGAGELLAAIDWLDTYERFLFGEIDRSDFLRSFIWDVELVGADKDEVIRRAKEIATPGPASVRVHNEQERWKAETPRIQAYESAAGARLYRNHILAGSAIPEHWSGGGGDVNRATAAEMSDPAMKVMQMRRNFWTEVLRRTAEHAVWRRIDPTGTAPPLPVEIPDDMRVTVDWPEMVERDVTRHTTALQQAAAAMVVGIEHGLMSEVTATRVLTSIAGRLGVEIDAAAEIEMARADAARRAADDAFGEE